MDMWSAGCIAFELWYGTRIFLPKIPQKQAAMLSVWFRSLNIGVLNMHFKLLGTPAETEEWWTSLPFWSALRGPKLGAKKRLL